MTLTWADGHTRDFVGCTDMVPGFVRISDLSQELIISAADARISIDDGRNAYLLERQ